MKNNVDISIVILNYNSIDYLKECLRSIKESNLSGIKIETIIVDNASKDKSVEIINKEYKWTKLIVSKVNKGFAGGNNLARNKVSGRYILFLNPDTVLSKNTLYKVFKFMEGNKDVGASTCRLELLSGELDYSTHRGFPSPLNSLFFFTGLSRLFPKTKFFTGYTQGWKLDDLNYHNVDAISGAFFFVRKEAAEDADWWDEDYFWYGEDLEFSYRLKEAGWEIMFLPKIKTIHVKGVTSGIKKHTKKVSKANRETKIRSVKASTQAMRIFYGKHYDKKYPKIMNSFVYLGIDLLEKVRTITV